MAALKVYGDLQVLYATVKAAQQTVSKQLSRVSKIKSNCLFPNSFPRIISTEAVCEKTLEILESNATGLEIVIT